MKPVRNWRAVLRYAWSIRLMLLAGLLSGIEAILPLLDGVLPVPPRLFAVLTFLTVGLAFVARLIAQKGISDEK
ncbi:hypothetical protein [Phyllobacterium endophyticum]|uniref:Uncharacterized protein n=1 Tax=Phyllobacterium endophyticum TaxID=1149773 RepID=A0A2P7AUR3_9HYPH|nr:hypothetical protein [Phyllobacterium endophyticum]MBB3234456.1 hypothetical protein [Phyllobacterium endophyticum]PSH57962.1 hypothetical protein CU100_09800 [Phyllobacterium endophyticum]TYR44170.1 hypothetical protein FY050_03150 [Phyllobacterium endophyticum]